MGFRNAVVVLLVGNVLGCATIRPVQRPAEFIPTKHPKELWVTSVDGKEWLLVKPRVEEGQVVGWARGRLEREVRVPLTEASRVQARQVHVTRTAVVTGLALLGGGAFLYAVSKGASSEDRVQSCDNPEVRSGQCY